MRCNRFLYLILIVTSTACFQEKEQFIPDKNPEDPAFIYKHPDNQPLRFLLSVDEETIFFKTNNNSILKIPYGSLLTSTGEFFKGNIVLEIIESDRIGDQIIHGKVPVSDLAVFRSNWLLSVQFFANGRKLNINPAKPIEWYSNIPDDMTVFGLYHEVIAENNNKTWIKKSDSQQLNWVIERDGEFVTGAGCVFALQDTGWYIIGNPLTIENENKLEICADSDAKYTSSNSIMYAVTEPGKILLPLVHSGLQSRFCHSSIKATPNSGIKFVLLSFQNDGKHYYAEKFVRIQENNIPELDPKPMPAEEIIKRIRAL